MEAVDILSPQSPEFPKLQEDALQKGCVFEKGGVFGGSYYCTIK